MAYLSGLPKRTLEKYMLRDGASLPGYDALVAMAKGFGVSLDWLVFGSDAASDVVALMVERCATETSQEVLDVIVREIIKAERPPLKDGELFNLTVEEWASGIGHDAAELARQLAKKGVTTQQLKLWQAGRNELTAELLHARFERFKSGENTPSS